jgi:hypothetical protein
MKKHLNRASLPSKGKSVPNHVLPLCKLLLVVKRPLNHIWREYFYNLCVPSTWFFSITCLYLRPDNKTEARVCSLAGGSYVIMRT